MDLASSGSHFDLHGLGMGSGSGTGTGSEIQGKINNKVKIALSLYKVQQNIYLLDFQRIEVRKLFCYWLLRLFLSLTYLSFCFSHFFLLYFHHIFNWVFDLSRRFFCPFYPSLFEYYFTFLCLTIFYPSFLHRSSHFFLFIIFHFSFFRIF